MAEGKNRAAGKWEQSEREAQGEAWSGAVALLRVRRLAAWVQTWAIGPPTANSGGNVRAQSLLEAFSS